MGSLSGLGIGLSLVFGCLLLGLVAELYYLLWWKKRFPNREIQDSQPTKNPKEFSYLFCWKTPNSVKGSRKRQELPIMNNDGHEQDLELGGKGKDFLQKSYGEESVESELMRLHNLCGPPRFLFTIKEETKEDLESEDGKSRNKSLSELFSSSVDTPLASPNLKTQSFDSYKQFGFNPLFESSTDAEISRLRSSPPPKFKFLRDAEEKLLRKLMESAAEKKCQSNGDLNQDSGVNPEEKDKSFVRIVVGKSKQKEIHQQLAQCSHSTASQVFPLAISPSEFRPFDNKAIGN